MDPLHFDEKLFDLLKEFTLNFCKMYVNLENISPYVLEKVLIGWKIYLLLKISLGNILF